MQESGMVIDGFEREDRDVMSNCSKEGTKYTGMDGWVMLRNRECYQLLFNLWHLCDW